MKNLIDVNFDMYSDTPPGKDPDALSPTLKEYHRILWSKQLPIGRVFELDKSIPKVLHHKSEIGEFTISSDAIGHTYHTWKIMDPIIKEIPSNEIDEFWAICSTIGAYMVFPSKKVNNKMTINGARGLNKLIKDRFDLSLECIRRYYDKESSPLEETLHRYSDFFDLFISFRGYVDFFLLQDLVTDNYSSIKFWLPFNNFEGSPIPKSVDEYMLFKKNLMDLIKKRNDRILSQ
tara:strand:+ start:149 stop:847 length:699 start_codon:yes stop_codon:yes gene_type:complete